MSKYIELTKEANRINGGNMTNALNDIKQIDRNSTVLLVMGTPCEKLSRGVSFNQNPKAKIGMRAEPSNLLFIAHELILTLQQRNIPCLVLKW